MDTPCNFCTLRHPNQHYPLTFNHTIIYGLILVLAVVQSLFGVGILLFGTAI